jgi:hypothetical protein
MKDLTLLPHGRGARVAEISDLARRPGSVQGARHDAWLKERAVPVQGGAVVNVPMAATRSELRPESAGVCLGAVFHGEI